jgi:hypothetical protein
MAVDVRPANYLPVAKALDTSRASALPIPGWLLNLDAKALCRGLAVIALAVGFVAIGGGSLELGELESRLGIAAAEGFGPFGQVYGGWEPSLWPVPVVASALWAIGEGSYPSAAAVRWPAVIAAVIAGFLLTRRMYRTVGARASVLLALCWFGSVALIDRSAGAGLDLIVGLATVGALGRIVGRGSDWVAGLWASLAFLSGGWPPLALIALATVVIGRREASLSWKLVIPPLVAAAAWSAWALREAQAEAWAAALTLPLTQRSAWMLAPGVLALGLPWTPLVVLAACRSVRDGWSPQGRALIVGWLQVAGACLVAGTVIPGLAPAARVPALAGLAVTAAAVADRIWTGTIAGVPKWFFLTIATLITAAWIGLVVVGGIFLASAVPYYRAVAIVLILASLLIGLVGINALLRADPRRGLIALAAVAVCLKIAHVSYYVPEWNYRRSQGPWGRAISQWVVPLWPIYTLHAWPHDLALATEHPFRQLHHPKQLAYQPGSDPKFVLLLQSEFEHWPDEAPPLVKVAILQDERGASRVVARTTGPFSWRAIVRARIEAERR